MVGAGTGEQEPGAGMSLVLSQLLCARLSPRRGTAHGELLLLSQQHFKGVGWRTITRAARKEKTIKIEGNRTISLQKPLGAITHSDTWCSLPCSFLASFPRSGQTCSDLPSPFKRNETKTFPLLTRCCLFFFLLSIP